MSSRKLNVLKDTYGYDDITNMLQDYMMSGTVPGICVSPVCDNIEEYEPDQNKGYCTECHNNTIASVLVMMGF